MHHYRDYVNVRIGHRAWSIFRDGTILRVIEGGDGSAAAPAATGTVPVVDPAVPAVPTPVAGDPDPTTGRTFTQAEVDAIASREAATAERKALKTLSDQLGMSPEEAKKALDDLNEKNLAAMTEADRKTTEAAQRDVKAGEREAAAAKREHEASLLVALLGSEVPAATAKDVAKLLDVEVGADEATITASIEALKTRLPALFTATVATPGTAPAGAAANGGRPPAAGASAAATTALDKGKERAAKANAQRNGAPVGASQ